MLFEPDVEPDFSGAATFGYTGEGSTGCGVGVLLEPSSPQVIFGTWMTGAFCAVEPVVPVTAEGALMVGTSIVGTWTVPAVTGTVGTLMVGVPVVDDCWIVVVGTAWVVVGVVVVALVVVVLPASGLLMTGTVGIEAPQGAFVGQLSAVATFAKPRTEVTTSAAAMMIRLIMGVFSCVRDRLVAGAVAGVEGFDDPHSCRRLTTTNFPARRTAR